MTTTSHGNVGKGKKNYKEKLPKKMSDRQSFESSIEVGGNTIMKIASLVEFRLLK